MDKRKRHTHFECGQSKIEYALILTLVAAVVVMALSMLGPAVGNVFSRVSDGLLGYRPSQETTTTQAGTTITDVSVRRKGDSDLSIDIRVAKPAQLTASTSDGASGTAECIDSCIIEISGVSNSAGTVLISSPQGDSVSMNYPSKIVSELQKPENVAGVTGTVSVLALLTYFVKSAWWKVSLKIASHYAASGSPDLSLRIIQQTVLGGKVTTAKLTAAWKYLIGAEALIQGAKPQDLLPFYELACQIAKDLAPAAQVESLTKLGSLNNELGLFDKALTSLKPAEHILYTDAINKVDRRVQMSLFNSLGMAYVHTAGDRLTNLSWANNRFSQGQQLAQEIHDKEGLKASWEGLNRLGKELTRFRRGEKAWGSAEIDGYEEEHRLYVGKTYALAVRLGWGTPPSEDRRAVSFALPYSLESFDFIISVWAEDTEIKPEFRTLTLDPASNSPGQVYFELTPGVAGLKEIKVEIYHKTQWLQQIAFVIEVIESPQVKPDAGDGTAAEAQLLKVGMLLGSGGLGDKSFNDSAYKGLESAHELYCIEFETAEPGTSEENVAILEEWAKAGYDLIIAVGYSHGPAIAQVAQSFPQKHFAIVDTEIKSKNVWSAVFREYETDIAVGALAALVTRTDREGARIGFIGGERNPIVVRIESAFRKGIESINPAISLNPIYVEKFDDETMGEYYAEILYRDADVIYQAAGLSGLGAIRAAQRLGKFLISTGADHSKLAPDAVLTSRIKNVYRPVLDVIQATVENRFEGGQTFSYGLANGGLSLTPLRAEVIRRISANVDRRELLARLMEITKAVTSGQFVVDFDEDAGANSVPLGDQPLNGEAPDSTATEGKPLDDSGDERSA